MKVRLTKVSDNINGLRTNEVVGDAYALPQVGHSFCLYSEALENPEEYVRQVITSTVQKLLPDGFRTLNSVYKLEQL